MDRVLKFVSFNVKGLNGLIKRKRVLTYLKKLQVDIAFLQETHLTTQEHKKLKREWVGQVVSSSFNSKARGVAILINKNTPLEILDTVIDPSGRYVFINCRIFLEQWSFLNLYAPNYDDELVYLKKLQGGSKIYL